jgi:hypothetical protein
MARLCREFVLTASILVKFAFIAGIAVPYGIGEVVSSYRDLNYEDRRLHPNRRHSECYS